MLVKDSRGKIKVGDWVRTNGDCSEICDFFEGEIGEIQDDFFYVWQNSKRGSSGLIPPKIFLHSWEINFNNNFATIEILKANSLNNNLKTMNLLEKTTLAFKSEPEKSFRKLGITNGDDILTDEGVKVFLSWLLKKNANDFKKEVVDPLIEEGKDNK